MRASNPAPDLSRIARQIELSWRIDDVRNARDSWAAATPDTCAAVLDGADKFARDVLEPLNFAMDRSGCSLVDGRVATAPGHRAAWIRLCRSRLAHSRSRRAAWRTRPAGYPRLRGAGAVRPRLPGFRHAARAAALIVSPDRCLWHRSHARGMAASACFRRTGRNCLRLRGRSGIGLGEGEHTRPAERRWHLVGHRREMLDFIWRS